MAGKQDILKSISMQGAASAEEASDRKRVKPARGPEAAREFAIDAARLMYENKCEQIVVMDLRGVSPICDFFVIANGTSERQMRAVVDHVKKMGKERGETPYGVSGYDESKWIVVDYVDVIIHLFDGEHRAYYDLDSLWGENEPVDWQSGYEGLERRPSGTEG